MLFDIGYLVKKKNPKHKETCQKLKIKIRTHRYCVRIIQLQYYKRKYRVSFKQTVTLINVQISGKSRKV